MSPSPVDQCHLEIQLVQYLQYQLVLSDQCHPLQLVQWFLGHQLHLSSQLILRVLGFLEHLEVLLVQYFLEHPVIRSVLVVLDLLLGLLFPEIQLVLDLLLGQSVLQRGQCYLEILLVLFDLGQSVQSVLFVQHRLAL